MSDLKKGDTFICTACKGVFECGWSDEEANKEAEELWDVQNASNQSNTVCVCDDCFKRITTAMPIKEWRAKTE